MILPRKYGTYCKKNNFKYNLPKLKKKFQIHGQKVLKNATRGSSNEKNGRKEVWGCQMEQQGCYSKTKCILQFKASFRKIIYEILFDHCFILSSLNYFQLLFYLSNKNIQSLESFQSGFVCTKRLHDTDHYAIRITLAVICGEGNGRVVTIYHNACHSAHLGQSVTYINVI